MKKKKKKKKKFSRKTFKMSFAENFTQHAKCAFGYRNNDDGSRKGLQMEIILLLYKWKVSLREARTLDRRIKIKERLHYAFTDKVRYTLLHWLFDFFLLFNSHQFIKVPIFQNCVATEL